MDHGQGECSSCDDCGVTLNSGDGPYHAPPWLLGALASLYGVNPESLMLEAMAMSTKTAVVNFKTVRPNRY
jgi:hypothetical protein